MAHGGRFGLGARRVAGQVAVPAMAQPRRQGVARERGEGRRDRIERSSGGLSAKTNFSPIS